ncbi:hypothetical protein W02_16890 [Nitrospira sp. KM1]|nr:hypothetical protein W02_16890 [Nitrospira sp. KM1]
MPQFGRDYGMEIVTLAIAARQIPRTIYKLQSIRGRKAPRTMGMLDSGVGAPNPCEIDWTFTYHGISRFQHSWSVIQ